MTYRDIITRIGAAGWRFSRFGKGAHVIYRHPTLPGIVVIAHGGKLSRDIPGETKNSNLRQA